MGEKLFATPDYITAEEIKRIRKQLGLTQRELAMLINASKPTVERWETSKQVIRGPIVTLLQLLEKNPEYVEQVRIPDRIYPVRLEYMCDTAVCTIIDVDEIKQLVRIVNYTDNVMFRAFGKNERPNYEEYQKFLESRCFPKTRDKMKLILKDLDLPFYDPFLIIEKTEGRMAEDPFWIRIVR